MKPYSLLASIAIFSITGSTFAASVSGEIGTMTPAKKPVVVTTVIKKPPQSTASKKYTQTVSYMTPAGKDLITFAVTTKNGVITSATVTPKSTNPISLSLQKTFSKKLSKSVVGKKAKNFKIDAIGGASLTTAAFVLFMKKAV